MGKKKRSKHPGHKKSEPVRKESSPGEAELEISAHEAEVQEPVSHEHALELSLGLHGADLDAPGMSVIFEGYQAFKDGNNAAVRRIVTPLLTADKDVCAPQTRERAERLLSMVRVDTKTIMIVSACALLFVTILLLVY